MSENSNWLAKIGGIKTTGSVTEQRQTAFLKTTAVLIIKRKQALANLDSKTLNTEKKKKRSGFVNKLGSGIDILIKADFVFKTVSADVF